MHNTQLIRFKRHTDEYGSLTPVEAGVDIPFDIKRIYYIYDVPPDVMRGFHSHKNLHQVLIPLNGAVSIRLKTPFEETDVHLDKPYEGLYIGPNIWREMYGFTPGSTLLVLASEYYDEADYIRCLNVYKNTYPFTQNGDIK